MNFKIVSYLAPNWFWFYEAVAAYLGRYLKIETQIISGESDPLLDLMRAQDEFALAFICGLPFIRYDQMVPNQLQPVVAPVMGSPRYQNRPIYFSDVIVNAASNLTNFADLKGKIWCYNDPGSNSGYNLLYYHLFQSGYAFDFIGKAIQSGSHQRSIRWIVEGKADFAAIDSTVLEQELRDFPELSQDLRVVDSIGPNPMPPVVAKVDLGAEYIHRIQSALLTPDAELLAAMEKAGVQRFAAVQSRDYDAIAQIYYLVMGNG
ncbi:phosphate/phosphite/phosphonate ABC transporter substrate-binding protein [Microseira sp. BLCC-F43]|jgi:phosphonate transport system substrate-binding protein|uniref:phosphate/phosphite/phosphonate ABC transporter substrate-binding protein n=1 Tax=Microseira sp. BLCC-F43 TaxID=3153602 RepID=UPI0035B71907